MSPTAVSPIASPMGILRKNGSVAVWRTGEFGCSSRVTNRQAESMKSPRPRASIRYSGQCWSTAVSARDRGVTRDAATSGRARTRSGRALDLKARAVEVVELLKGLDQQIVDGKPDRSAPVGVSAEETRARFCRLVVHAVFIAIDDEPIGMITVEL